VPYKSKEILERVEFKIDRGTKGDEEQNGTKDLGY